MSVKEKSAKEEDVERDQDAVRGEPAVDAQWPRPQEGVAVTHPPIVRDEARSRHVRSSPAAQTEGGWISSPHTVRPSPDRQAHGSAEGSSRGVAGWRRVLISTGTRLFNPLTRRFAGRRWFPAFALVRHRGRRSGRVYATPVGARPTADGFVIPLTFGERADWFRNVQAAGGCVIRWRGAEYSVIEPELVDWATARSAFSPVERIALPLLGVTLFVRLRHAQPRDSSHA